VSKVTFPCGCFFDRLDDGPDIRINRFGEPLPFIKYDVYTDTRLDCPVTWLDLLCEGKTIGIFQLETQLGRAWSKRVKPVDLEMQGALVALLRPGCIAKDIRITTKIYNRPKRKKAFKKLTIEEIYKRFHSGLKINIVSLDTTSNLLFENKINDVIYNGKKECYKPIFNTVQRNKTTSRKYHNLICTNDHLLLSHDRGWIELVDLRIGERVAVINFLSDVPRHKTRTAGQSNFRDVCFQNYQYKCIFCDWLEGSLDVNHIYGNRKTNNDPKNLCFMCPNHHRLFCENKITAEQILLARKDFELQNTEHIQWAEYSGSEKIGLQEVYDITVDGPYYNFIAGNVVVHNCLKAMSGDPPKSMTERYKDRRHNEEPVDYFGVPELKEILEPTYGVLVYQEQAMKIAVALAGFNEQEADILRKAIGKKKPEIMAEVEKDFLTGCEKMGIVDSEKAKEIFGWIKESQRYSFNKSHAITYGKNSYWSAYCKAHFPVQFYCSYLMGATWKQESYEERKILVQDAKEHNVAVNPPDFRDLEKVCYIKDNQIYFGLMDIRDVGESSIEKMFIHVREVELLLDKKLEDWSWLDYLIYFSSRTKVDVVRALILSGALDFFQKQRIELENDLEKWLLLTDKEQHWIYSHQYGQFNGSKSKTPPRWERLSDCVAECAKKKKDGGGCHNINRVRVVEGLAKQLSNPSYSLEDSPDRIIWGEEKYLGTPLTMTLVDACSDSFKATITCKEILDKRDGFHVVAVEITRLKEHKTKNGKNPGSRMAFLEVKDTTCVLDSVVCFTNEWKTYKDLLFESNTVLIQLQRTKKGSFSVKKVKQI